MNIWKYIAASFQYRSILRQTHSPADKKRSFSEGKDSPLEAVVPAGPIPTPPTNPRPAK